MVKICRTGLLKLNFEIVPKKRIFRFLPKISAGHGWSWKIFFANFQTLGPLGCQGWVVIPQNVKKSQNHCTLIPVSSVWFNQNLFKYCTVARMCSVNAQDLHDYEWSNRIQFHELWAVPAIRRWNSWTRVFCFMLFTVPYTVLVDFKENHTPHNT